MLSKCLAQVLIKMNLILTKKKTRETAKGAPSTRNSECPLLSREARFPSYNPENPYSEHLSHILPTFFLALVMPTSLPL